MLTRRPVWLAAISVLCVSVLALSGLRAATDTLPSQLTDQEFWKLSTDFSEPDGFFRSDNLLSNEVWLQRVIPELLNTVKTPSVYMGVGPEQNFTYIAALKPKMVFLVDVRRGNLDLQLMYKALFELSADRAEFVSKMFSRKRPEGLDRNSTAADIFAAYQERREQRGAVQGEPEGHRRPAADQTSFRAVGRRRAGRRVRVPRVLQLRAGAELLVHGRVRRPLPAELRGSDGGDRRGRAVAELPRQRGQLQRAEVARDEEPAGARSSATSPGPRRSARSATT